MASKYFLIAGMVVSFFGASCSPTPDTNGVSGVSQSSPADAGPVIEAAPTVQFENARLSEQPSAILNTGQSAAKAPDLEEGPATPELEPEQAAAAAVATAPAEPDKPQPLFPEDTSPLSDEARQMLANIKWDMAPEVLNAVLKENEGGHFPWSDELHPDRFYDTIRGLGGTYIGVGTDQAYVFISWQRPTLAFTVDYDPWVVCIHQGYHALFDTCENIDCFRKMLDDKDGTYKFLLNTYYAENPERREIAKIFRANSHGFLRQLNRIAKLPYPTFVNDADSYNYIRTLIKSGRLVTLQANLLGNVALKGISDTLRESGRTVTTLYTSNAEQYWSYGKQFKENMRGIPWAENGVVMRTLATKPMNKDYTYRVMPHKVFLAWLDDPRGKDVKRISKRYRFETRPEDSTEPPEVPFILDDVMPEEAPIKR